jgi:periplasmic copper chaperone A
MRQSHQRALGVAWLVLWLAAQAQAHAQAQAPVPAAEYRAGDLVVAQPWSRPTPPVATVGAVYFSLTNVGRKADRLMSISSPIASNVEIHESRQVQGIVQMRALTALECPPGATVKSEPGGLHVMLLGLSRPLLAGMEFPLSLRFRDAGVLTVLVRVGERQ